MHNVLATCTITGNLIDLREYCNERGLADYLLGWERAGQYVVAIFRLPECLADKYMMTY